MKEIQVRWITDRLPTSDDAIYGMVIKPDGGVGGWCHISRHNIVLGEAWHPAFRVVTEKSNKQHNLDLLRQLPEEYAERAINQNEWKDDCLKSESLERAIWDFATWDQTKEGVEFWHTISDYCCDAPEDLHSEHEFWNHLKEILSEPMQVPWERVSDVPNNARWFMRDCEDLIRPLQYVTEHGVGLSVDVFVAWKSLADHYRCSNHPFDQYKDGNPCTKERKIV